MPYSPGGTCTDGISCGRMSRWCSITVPMASRLGGRTPADTTSSPSFAHLPLSEPGVTS
ncbi:hypothetical protein [Nonomuraea salmonea]|uniref:hypothetical protein n=1 Tax=Nonomuraea salmonea TaxID=46181 RepID=UPI0031E5AA79